MASRIVHYAIANLVAQTCPPQNFDRFLLGHLLPDAYCGTLGTQHSHLKLSLSDTGRTYDLEKFRSLFPEELKNDDLYRGYYLHLIQDLYFRDFVYNRHHWNPMIPGNVQRLHRDYSLANAYVIQRYQLENQLVVPENFTQESLCQLYPFDTAQLTADFSSDFTPTNPGEFFFFTPEMTDAYIQIAAAVSIQELAALDKGYGYTDMYRMAWGNL